MNLRRCFILYNFSNILCLYSPFTILSFPRSRFRPCRWMSQWRIIILMFFSNAWETVSPLLKHIYLWHSLLLTAAIQQWLILLCAFSWFTCLTLLSMTFLLWWQSLSIWIQRVILLWRSWTVLYIRPWIRSFMSDCTLLTVTSLWIVVSQWKC
jgi:hypothetical protein